MKHREHTTDFIYHAGRYIMLDYGWTATDKLNKDNEPEITIRHFGEVRGRYIGEEYRLPKVLLEPDKEVLLAILNECDS